MKPENCEAPWRVEKNKCKISDLQGRNRELEKQIRELEDTDIIGMVRENGMTMEQFAELFLRRMQAAPAPATSEKRGVELPTKNTPRISVCCFRC